MPPKESDAVESLAGSTSIPGGATDSKYHDNGYFLRWSRLRKTVELQDTTGGGLMRSSIASKRGSLGAAVEARPSMAATKDILSGVSGYAAPGELLACMGPSGSGYEQLVLVNSFLLPLKSN